MATKIRINQVSKKLADWMKRIEVRIEKLEKKCSGDTIKKSTRWVNPKVASETIKMVKKACKKKHE